MDFDPFAISKLNEKKIAGPGSPACSLLSELKLRAIIENARQMCKVNVEYSCSLLDSIFLFRTEHFGFMKFIDDFRGGKSLRLFILEL